MKEFKISTDLNSKRTDCPFGTRQPFLSRLCEPNTNTEFLFHISAKLNPAHVKIAPLPKTSDVICLW